MNKKMLYLILLIASCIIPGTAWAEFDELGTSARTAGMGDAFTAIADDAYAIIYNPAGLGRIHHKEFATNFNKLYLGLDDSSALNESFIGAVYGTEKYGTFGIGIKQFSAGQLYKENATLLSYGIPVKPSLYLGLNVKALSKEYSQTLYTENAVDFQGASHGRDPVFANGYKKTVYTFDIASYYQIAESYAAGLIVKNINQPNTGLQTAVNLPMIVKAGISYQDDRITIPIDIENEESDYILSGGIEKWLLRGQAALRSGLQLGTRELTNISFGMSAKYRESIRFDYGLVVPLRGIKQTYGTHKLSIVISFGKAAQRTYERKPKEKRIKTKKQIIERTMGGSPDLAPAEPMLFTSAVSASRNNELINAYTLFSEVTEARVDPVWKKESKKHISEIMDTAKKTILKNASRKEVAYHIGLLKYGKKQYKDAYKAWKEFLQYDPENSEVRKYLSILERYYKTDEGKTKEFDQKSQEKANETRIPEKQEKIENAYRFYNEKEYKKSIKICLQIIKTEPANKLAYTQLGSSYYALGDKKKAVKAWKKVLELDPQNGHKIRSLLERIEKTSKNTN